MKTISELKTYEIKLLKKYCEKMIYIFNIFDDKTVIMLKETIKLCDEVLNDKNKFKN